MNECTFTSVIVEILSADTVRLDTGSSSTDSKTSLLILRLFWQLMSALTYIERSIYVQFVRIKIGK